MEEVGKAKWERAHLECHNPTERNKGTEGQRKGKEKENRKGQRKGRGEGMGKEKKKGGRKGKMAKGPMKKERT